MAATMGTVSTIGGRYLNNKVSPPQTPLASGIAKSMDALADSKTAKRSPETTKAFLDENLKDMVAEDMNVSSKGFMQFWRDNDPDNPNRVYEEAQKFDITPEKLFCLHYVQSNNATQAYVNAYGCTRRAVGANGHRLLKNDEIRAEIKRLRRLMEIEMDVNSMGMIRFCLKVVGADIGDYLEFRPQEIDVTTSDGTTTKGTISSVLVKDSAYCDTSLIKDIRQQGASVHVELYSKQWALDKLDKFFGWTAAKQAETGEGNVSIVIVSL